VIDAHHHIWRLARGDYDWLTPDLPIHRDYTLDDLRPQLGNITATILVQAAPTTAETDFLLEIANKSNGLVQGVVGWTDLAAPDAPARIEALAAHPKLVGLRPMLQDHPDRTWILRPDLEPALQAMAQAGLVLDLLILTPQLDQVPRLASANPNLRMVIDHAAKPPIAQRSFEPWATLIAEAAKPENVWCKLSGLATEAAPDWRPADLKPYVDHLLATFGSHRLLWGSDWPVLDLAGGYLSWRNATNQLLAGQDFAARASILGNTARALYRR
jgi:L-fuconolactonase